MNTYATTIQLETERQSMEVVQKRLDRVKQTARQQGFELLEVHTRGLTSAEEQLDRK